jgi:hypothetical protein
MGGGRRNVDMKSPLRFRSGYNELKHVEHEACLRGQRALPFAMKLLTNSSGHPSQNVA